MSGRIVRQGHTCRPPSPLQHEAGTVWQCDCGLYWHLSRGSSWVHITIVDRILLGFADGMAQGQRKREPEDRP